MTWAKGEEAAAAAEKARGEEFTAAVKVLTDDLLRFEVQIGVAALAYVVACFKTTKPDLPFDKMVDVYVNRINTEMKDEMRLITELHKRANTPEDVREMIKYVQRVPKKRAK